MDTKGGWSDRLEKPIKITVCKDGFVSIMAAPSDRRLKAALPFYSVDTVEEALNLISALCPLRACAHGGKIGLTLEPQVPGWLGTIAEIPLLAERFHVESQKPPRKNT